MDNLEFNFCAAMHNLGLVSEARKLINNFINDGEGFIYAINPDGTYLKLQKGVNLQTGSRIYDTSSCYGLVYEGG